TLLLLPRASMRATAGRMPCAGASPYARPTRPTSGVVKITCGITVSSARSVSPRRAFRAAIRPSWAATGGRWRLAGAAPRVVAPKAVRGGDPPLVGGHRRELAIAGRVAGRVDVRDRGGQVRAR